MKRKVSDYMTEEVECFDWKLSVKGATELFLNSTHHAFPVVKDGKLVGIVTARELLESKDSPEKSVHEIMQRDYLVLRPETELEEAAHIMFSHGLNRLPVVDNSGRLVGILTNADVLRSYIERTTPRKVETVKRMIESKFRVLVETKLSKVQVERLRPTQPEIYEDELVGREYEIKRGLAEPIIVVRRRNHYLLIDGHHRAVAAQRLGVRELEAYVLEPQRNVRLELEKECLSKGVMSLADVTIRRKPSLPRSSEPA